KRCGERGFPPLAMFPPGISDGEARRSRYGSRTRGKIDDHSRKIAVLADRVRLFRLMATIRETGAFLPFLLLSLWPPRWPSSRKSQRNPTDFRTPLFSWQRFFPTHPLFATLNAYPSGKCRGAIPQKGPQAALFGLGAIPQSHPQWRDDF